MGKNIKKINYQASDYSLFQEKLYQQLTELKSILAKPNFGKEIPQLGAELEMYLVDDAGQVSLSNQSLLADLADDQFQPELNQYNLELNLKPVPQQGKPFTKLRNEILEKTGYLEHIANQHKVNIMPVGILPTLRIEHLNKQYMTDLPRYHALANKLYQDRGEAFQININGEEPISIGVNDICAEGANTSFQVHLMVPPEKFVAVFNAAQLTLPLVTAISANSSVFLGKRVWDETRIALFKQSLDIRLRDNMKWQQPTRVNFGFGWLRHSVWDLFAEAVALYPPLLPEITDDHDRQGLPALNELNLHMGTIWPWNRPVFSNAGNGHIRLEFRAIPAGPTSFDMVANAALAIGLAIGMSESIDEYLAVMPFRFAEYNFYRAAQHGLEAKILWPHNNPYKPEEVSLHSVLSQLIPIAKKGLLSIGVDSNEACEFINIIQARLSAKITGAIWQKNTLIAYEKTLDKDQACKAMVQKYISLCRTCTPVSQWEQPWR